MAAAKPPMKSTTSAIVMKPSGSLPWYLKPGRRLCELGVSSRSESQRSRRQEFATSPRSSTTCSIERSVSMRLTARPVCPAPMTTTVTRSIGNESPPRWLSALLPNLDRDVRRVRDDVVDGRSLLRLCDERLDVFLRRVGVDVERHLDVVVAVAHIAVDAEDALDVHRAFELRFHGAQLNAAVLRDRCDTCGEAARETREHELDRCRAAILGREDLGMIRF